MICISIGKPSVKTCKDIFRRFKPEMAEIRLDGAELSAEEIGRIFSMHPGLIVTCRPEFPGRCGKDRQKNLMTAIIAGAACVDLELESEKDFKNEIIQMARLQQCRVILSYHNYDATPSKPELEEIVGQCFSQGADVAKVACFVHNRHDCGRILGLYDYPARLYAGSEIIAIGMGAKGKITRLAAPLLGAPFTYAAPGEGDETALGQLDFETMSEIYKLMA